MSGAMVTVARPNEMSQVGSLERFIAQKLALPSKTSPTAFWLVLCVAGEPEQVVNTFHIPPANEREPDWGGKLAHEIYAEGRANVDGNATANRYALVALCKNEQVGRTFFTCHPPLDGIAGVGTASEPPTAPGLLTHGMRWADTMARLTLGNLQTQLERQQQLLSSAHARELELQGRVSEQFDRIQALQDKNWERDLAMQREKRDEDRAERLMMNFEKFLLPAIAQKIGVPVNGTISTDAPNDIEADPIGGFVYLYFKLSEEQKAKLIDVLDDEQKTIFMHVLSGAMKAKAKDKAA